MSAKLSNNATSRLAASIGTGDTSLSVQAGDGAKFPAITSPDWFPLTALKADGTLEVMKCTGRSGDVLTIVRAQEGTSAKAFAANDRIELRLTANTFEDRMSEKLDKAGGAINGDLSVSGKLSTGSKLVLKVGASVASATTLDLTAATGSIVHITGTNAITSVTLEPGQIQKVIFDGTLTLTHHATNNNLPGSANVTTAAGDRATYVSDGTTVYCLDYVRADGTPLVRAHNIGDIFDHTGSTPPVGSMAVPLTQTNVSRTTYAKLFARIGTTWGAGDGVNTFGLPWMPADYVTSQANNNVGTQTVGQNLSHNHGVSDPSHSHGVSDPGHRHNIVVENRAGASATTGNGGGGYYDVSTGSIQPAVTGIGIVGSTTGISIQSSGGTANLAAGIRVMKCLQVF